MKYLRREKKEMPQYKLIYFNARGRGELSRLILHYAGVEFEDYRFEMKEWPSIKPNMPFGQVPVLEVDGSKLLAQSHTIARYLARQHGLAGKDEWENALTDSFVACIQDFHTGMRPAVWESDADKQKQLFDAYNKETIQPHLKKIEEQLEANGSNYLVGSELTWADIAYFAYFTTPIMTLLGGQVLDNSPRLKKLIETVGANEKIKSYIENRPVTKM